MWSFLDQKGMQKLNMILWHTHILFLYFLHTMVIFASFFHTSNSFPDTMIFFNHCSVLNSNSVLLWSCYEIEVVILYFLQMVQLRCREIKSLYCRELSGMTFPIMEKCLIHRSESCKQRNGAWNSLLWWWQRNNYIGKLVQLHFIAFFFLNKSVNCKI